MVTLRDKFHELGNWHNKISMGAITARESLIGKGKLSGKELKVTVEKSVKILEKIEGYIEGADKTIDSMKFFIYEKIGGDTEISQEGKHR